MNQLPRRVRRYGRTFFNVKTLVLCIGVFASVALHELFHVMVHWGQIVRIEFFPDVATIIAITSHDTGVYSQTLEEGVAYTITLVTLFMTCIIMFALSDPADSRTCAELLFPNDERMQKLTPEEFYELALRARRM